MTISNIALRAALLAGAVLPLMAMPMPAAAQETAETVDYDLPPQTLSDRLRAIARLSGREIIFSAGAVEGRSAPALRGRYTLEQAMRAALADTGLGADYRAGAVLVRPRSAASDPFGGPGETESPSSQAITVTGTRIRGAGSPSPVIVTSRVELEEAGVTDLTGFTRYLPQNFTGGQNPGIAGGGQQGGQNNVSNSATLNLRGLGPDATLTLLNGHRLAYDALNQGVDISAIPLAAVERIEAIPDGASALYGSDAVGGVANIILRRDFQGLELTGRVGGSTDGGNVQQQYSAVGGGRWGSGGFMIAGDYLHATPIVAGQRDYASALDDGATLISGQSRLSLVFAGHQDIAGGVSLELDGTFMHRRSLKATPFFVTGDVFTNGLYNRPEVDSYSVTPTLRFALRAGWEGRASFTHAFSRTEITSRRFTSSVESRSWLIYENRLNSLEANAEGPLFSLPGGSARLAVGGGLRSVLLDVNVTQLTGGVRRATRDFTEARDIQFAYGELSLPLIGPANDIPLIERLSLNGALRYERYQGIDEVVTPKLGLVYQPLADVTLRLSWGRSFKVPTLNQVNQARTGTLNRGNVFTPQPVPPLPAGATVLTLSGGNPDLGAERAESWAAGIEVRPRFLPGLRLEATWFDVDYRNRISSPFSGTLAALANPAFAEFVTFNPTLTQIADLVASLPQGLVNQTGQPFDPGTVVAILDASLQNIARERVRGVDFALDYRMSLGDAGSLRLGGQLSYLDSERQISVGQPVLRRTGMVFNPPHWRWRLGGTWDRGNAGLSVFVNRLGGTIDDRFGTDERIGGFVTLDASLRLRSAAARGPLRDVELRLSAQNLLDEAPSPIRDPDPAAPPYDSTNQSPVGRFISVSVTKSW